MPPTNHFGRKDFLPVEPPGRSLLPVSPKRTQVRLKSLLYLVWLTPDPLRTHGRPSGQECRLRLKRPPSRLACSRGTFHLYPRPRSALLRLRPFSAGRSASLRFRPKKYGTAYFSRLSLSLAKNKRWWLTRRRWFLLKRFSRNPDVEKARAEFGRAQKVEERLYYLLSASGTD